MATSQGSSEAPRKYYFCHSCARDFVSSSQLCSNCGSEFVEERAMRAMSPSTSVAHTPPSGSFLVVTQTAPSGRSLRSTSPSASRGRGRVRGIENIGEMLGQYMVQLIQAREQLEDSENYTLPVIPPPPQFLDLMFRAPRQRSRASNASPSGSQPSLDGIVTRLLEQLLESGGPPPAEQDKIDSLPTLILGAEDLSGETECSICKEPFKENDHARQLPCTHLFHNDCITPWLKLRDTCPTCRYSLNKGEVVTDTRTDSTNRTTNTS